MGRGKDCFRIIRDGEDVAMCYVRALDREKVPGARHLLCIVGESKEVCWEDGERTEVGRM